LAAWQRGILYGVVKDIKILKVEVDGEDGVIVTFSDGTIGGYVVDELLLLSPVREAVEEPVDSDCTATIVKEIRFPTSAPCST
jgi:hypothetical protein